MSANGSFTEKRSPWHRCGCIDSVWGLASHPSTMLPKSSKEYATWCLSRLRTLRELGRSSAILPAGQLVVNLAILHPQVEICAHQDVR